MSIDKNDIYAEAARIWNPGKVQTFRDSGIDIVFGERNGYVFRDGEGRQLVNMHLNGGVFNLGHRNPEVQETLIRAVQDMDAGNHYFPSEAKNRICRDLLAIAPPSMRYVNLNNGGGESIDAAIKFARHATGRRKVISLRGCFHGATGLALQAGNPDMASFFHSTPDPREFVQVDFNDLPALEEALREDDAACVVAESLQATSGFPLPAPDYFRGLADACRRHGTLYIADEVQTGLMRAGTMWCCSAFGAEPDMIVTGKGLSGGYYPMSAVIMNEASGRWMHEDGFAHLSSFNGTEPGCAVASRVVEITSRPSTKENVDMLTHVFARGLADIQTRHSRFFTGIRQKGVIMGLETAHPEGSTALMGTLYRNGVWAMRANFDQRVLQFKAGLLMEKALAERVLDILDTSMGQAAGMLGMA